MVYISSIFLAQFLRFTNLYHKTGVSNIIYKTTTYAQSGHRFTFHEHTDAVEQLGLCRTACSILWKKI